MSKITISCPSKVIICPGIHDSQLTQNFLDALQSSDSSNLSRHWTQNVLIFPIQDYPAYSAIHILQFLQHHTSQTTPIIFIGFSAGVAGAIGAAWGWEMMGGKVKAFFALDGWGVPLYGNFPIHRLSHDYFTHWSSALLGAGDESFYAEPEIGHLDLWKKPEYCSGWQVHPATSHQPEQRTYTTAAQFVNQLVHDGKSF
jgi:hypothetical protein